MHFYFLGTYNFVYRKWGCSYVISWYNRSARVFRIFKVISIRCSDIFHGSSLFPEPLNSEEEKKYLEKLKEGDEDARNILIEKNLRLVAHVCKKYTNTNVEQDDLISIGTIGLIKGINSFKLEKGAKLSTYVSRCIDNEILMHLRAIKKLNAEVYLNEPIRKR
jgi:RNA polymerase sporulation-specific sigma factor